jgi:hypothetical protein
MYITLLESLLCLLRDLKSRSTDLNRLEFDCAWAMELLVNVIEMCGQTNLAPKTHDTYHHIIKDALEFGPDLDAFSTGTAQF